MPSVATIPYDSADYVLNLARSIVNDASQSIAGNVLANDQPYTIPMLNSVYRTLQEDLTDGGVETFAQEIILGQFPPSFFPTDPATQCRLSYTGSFDGYNSFLNPHLPATMIGPLRLWERQSGNTAALFQPLLPTNDGIPARPAGAFLQQWEWRADALYFVGAMQMQDLRLRYNQFFPDLVDGDSTVLIPARIALSRISWDGSLPPLVGRRCGSTWTGTTKPQWSGSSSEPPAASNAGHIAAALMDQARV